MNLEKKERNREKKKGYLEESIYALCFAGFLFNPQPVRAEVPEGVKIGLGILGMFANQPNQPPTKTQIGNQIERREWLNTIVEKELNLYIGSRGMIENEIKLRELKINFFKKLRKISKLEGLSYKEQENLYNKFSILLQQFDKTTKMYLHGIHICLLRLNEIKKSINDGSDTKEKVERDLQEMIKKLRQARENFLQNLNQLFNNNFKIDWSK
ncbi:MAG: hypothetical protein KAI16_01760 [Candidatus Pacebacteria bacterium]|nr:hypothetical protein [Candidatus Paceibacterota bacterium]